MKKSDDLKQFTVKTTSLVTAWLFFVGQVHAQAQAIPQIVPDGQTLTSLQAQGSSTTITTGTLIGGNGINSFSKFDVHNGNTVNLHVPDQANSLLNLIHQQRSQIDGIVNGYQNGAIGGNVFFLNPQGIVIGEQGVINATSVHLMTPNATDMQAMLQGSATSKLAAMQALQEGVVPMSDSGLITIKGQVNALNAVKIKGQNVDILGAVNAGQQGAINFAEAVNLGDVQTANVLTIAGNGDVFIGAQENINVSGQIGADAITQAADAGQVLVMAQDTATLAQGARLSADADAGEAGFVEFSAQDTVVLSGGALSADSQFGEDGQILIDPENIVIATDLLRGSGVTGPDGASWNAGSLTLQASESITISANQVVSSRQVADPSLVASHQNGASTGDSGDLVIEAPSIVLQSGSELLAQADSGFNAGDVTLSAVTNGAASISLDNATIKGNDVSLMANGSTEGAFINLDPADETSATISISNNSAITATNNVIVSADATQAKPVFSGLVLQLDARTATADVDLANATISATGNVQVTAEAEVFTDLSSDGFTDLENDITSLAASSLSPISLGVAVTTSSATTDLTGATSISGADVTVSSLAQTDSTVASESTAVGGAIVTSVSVITNTAQTQMADSSSITATGAVNVTAKGKALVDSIADASVVSAQGSGGSVAVAVTSLDSSTIARIQDNAQIVSSTSTNLHADTINTVNTGARAGVGSLTNNAGQVLDEQMGEAGIDDTARANLKTGFEGAMSKVMEQMDNSASGDSTVQMAGGLSFANVTNVTKAEMVASTPATDTTAPSLTSSGLASVQARAVTQANSMGSGKTKKATYGGGAGVGFINGSNTVKALVQGAQSSPITISSNGINVKALTQSYDTNIVASNQNKFGAQAYAGQQASGENGIGLAGAVAIGLVETNDVEAEIAADSTINANSGNLAVEATNHTDVKVESDGRPRKKNAVDAMFSMYNSLDEDGTSGGGQAKLGIGAAIAVSVSENLAHAKIDGDTAITNVADLTVDSDQTGATEAEANSAGAGGIAIVPIAAVTVARDTSKAELLSSDNALTITGQARVQALQNVSSAAIGSGTAGNDATNADIGIGMSAAINVALTTAEANVDRDLSATGDVTIKASSQRSSAAGAVASVNSASGDYDTDREEGSSADVATSIGKLVSLGNSFSGESTSSSDITDKASTDKDGNSANEDETSLSLAAALGVNYVENTTVAQVKANRVVSGANMQVQSENNTDAEALADGSAGSGDSDYNIAGAIGLNIVTLNNTAKLEAGSTVSGANVTVKAKTRDSKEILDDEGLGTGEYDSQSELKAEAQAGAGTGNFSLAGAAAINVILANNTKALLIGTSNTTSSGNLVVDAQASTKYRTYGSGQVGDARPTIGGLKDSLSSFDDLVVRVGKTADGIKSHITTSEGSEAAAPSDSDNPSEEGDGGSGTGIGASFSINVITSEQTQAEIENNAIVSSGGLLNVNASGASALETISEAGAAPTGDISMAEEQAIQKNALDAAVAIGVLADKDVVSRIGSGSTITVAGDIGVNTTDVTDALVTSDGEAVGDNAAVGAAVSVSVIIDNASAYVGRSLTSTGGSIAVTTDADSTDVVTADAMSRGAVVERWANKFSVSEDDILGGAFGSGGGDGPTSAKALSGDFSGGQGAQTQSVESDGGDDSSKSESINIAAAVGVNYLDHDSQATLGDGITLTSAGDVDVAASNDLNYKTRGSGLTVFSDTGIGVGVALLVSNNSTIADTGNNTTIIDSGTGNSLNVLATTSRNQATGYSNKLAAEAMAGAGAGKLGVAGALAVVVSNDSVKARIGTNNTIGGVGNEFDRIQVLSTKTNKIATRAWAAAVASDATCSDPGNCDSDGDKNAIGAAFSVIVTNDENEAEVDERSAVAATGEVAVRARDLRPSEQSRFELTGDELDEADLGITSTNYTADLQNSSYYTEAIGGAAAQGGNAFAGSFAITVNTDQTKSRVGEGVSISAGSFLAEADNQSDVRSLAGAVALAEKTGVGISLVGTVLTNQVSATVGDTGIADGSYADTSITTTSGDLDVRATANQKATTLLVAAGVSTSQSSGAGALSINVLDSTVLAAVEKDTNLVASSGSIDIDANAEARIRSFAGGVGAASDNAFGGSLALNLFLTNTQARLGEASNAANNIDLDASVGVNVTADTHQDLLNAVVGAAVSGNNAIGGALAVNTIKGVTKALINADVNVNQDSTIDAAASSQSVTVRATDATDIVDFTGAGSFGSSAGVGIGLDANVVWKDTKAIIAGSVSADTQIDVIADVEENMLATVVGLAGGGSDAVGGSVGLMLIKNDVQALVESTATLFSDGNIKVHAEDDSDVFFLTGGGGFGGSNGIAGAFGVTVHVGTTRAAIKDSATVTALGNQAAMDVVTGDIATSSQLFQSMNGDVQGSDLGDDTQSDLTGRGDSDSEDSVDDSVSAKTVTDFKNSLRSETKAVESRKGLSVTAFSDQDIISAAASLGVGGSNAVAVSLSAGVSANTIEAFIGNATINGSNGSAGADQGVIVRSKADMNWIDVSGAISGGGSVGVGLAGDAIVQVKTTKAFIASGATVNARKDVNVEANASDRVVASVASGGGGGSVGVNGTAAIAVTNNTTHAYVDGTVNSGNDLTVDALAKSELIQVSGAIGFGGSVGVGASFGVSVVRNETKAYLGANATTNASGTTRVKADTDEIVRGVTFAGSGGGAVGVAFGMGIRVHQSNSSAYILADVNQNASYDSATQDVIVRAENNIHMVDVVGGVSGGGTVGVGLSANALVIRNTANAYIGDGTNVINVDAGRDISVTADSDKTADSYMIAFGGGGVVGVGGAVSVITMGALVDDDMKGELGGGSDEGDTWGKVDDRTQTDLTTGNLVSTDDDHSDAAGIGSDIETEMTTYRSEGAISDDIETTNAGLNRNRTQAYIANNASVDAGQDLILDAGEVTTVRMGAGAGAGGGVVGVGATIGLVMIDNTAEAFVGNATANAGRSLKVGTSTQENLVGAYIAGGGAAVTAVNGVVMTNVIQSDSLAYIDAGASVNLDADGTDTQLVEVSASSSTDVVVVGGSGGGAIVGVGVTGGVLIIDKDTKAKIASGANVDSAGDVTVDADSRADVALAAASVNGGVVGVTGVVAVQTFSNDTQAFVEGGATITAEDSIRVQATDDTEVDVIPIGGAGGAVGVAATFATNTLSNTTKAWIGNSSATTIQALGKHTGLASADGSVTNITTQDSIDANNNDGDDSNDSYEFDKLATTFDTSTNIGLSVVAVSHEDVRTIPIGVAIGGAAVNGVISTTLFDSTTEAIVESGVSVNASNTGAGTEQDVSVVAVGTSNVNSIATGVAGAASNAVAASLDTTIYKKVVRARMLGTAATNRDIKINAQSNDTLLQTVGSVAASGTDATAGAVGVAVIGSTVLAEVGDSATAKAGRDLLVNAREISNITQVAGQAQVGGGVGLGLSLGIKVVKTNTQARIGSNAVTAATRNTQVDAQTTNNITQNVVAFGGGGIAAINGAVGVNVIKTTTLAEIGSSANVNQDVAYNSGSEQDVVVVAEDDITVLDNIGAGSIGGVAGVGIGLGVTVVRNTTQGTVGSTAIVSATRDVSVSSTSRKDIFNTAVAGAGGLGLGAAGSVSIALVGNAMSDDASGKLSNDNGNIVSEADAKMSQDRKAGYSTSDQTDADGSDTSTAAGNANSVHLASHNKDTLIASETTGLAADINGSAPDTTTAQIGVGASITAGRNVSVSGVEYVRLRQVSGGVALGAGAIGGWAAVTDYNANAQALVYEGASIDVDNDDDDVGNLTITSGLLEDGGNSRVETIGGAAGLVGLAGTFSVFNFNGSATSSLGYAADSVVTPATTNITGAQTVSIISLRDVDTEVESVGAAVGLAGAGAAISTLNAQGSSVAEIGRNVNLGTSAERISSLSIDADNTSTQDVSSTAAAVGVYLAAAGADSDISDSGTTQANIGSGSTIYSSGSIALSADDDMRNEAESFGVTVSGGISVGAIFADTSVSRNVLATTGDNVVLDASAGAVSLVSNAGNNIDADNIRAAYAKTVAGSGGLFAGVNGTEANVVMNINTQAYTGSGVTINASNQNISLEGDNQAVSLAETEGYAFGAFAAGGHNATTSNNATTNAFVGSNASLSTTGQLLIRSQQNQQLLNTTVAGSGGALAVTAAESSVNHTANQDVGFADSMDSSNNSIVNVGSLLLEVVNNDDYDASLDATGVGIAQASGGTLIANGTANLKARVGNYTELNTSTEGGTSAAVTILADNNLQKAGISDSNFVLEGGGALSVSLGESVGVQTQNTDLEFGQYSVTNVAGTYVYGDTHQGDVSLRALNYVQVDDEATVSTGGAISVPRAKSVQIGNSTADITFENNSVLNTARGDLDMSASTSSNMDVRTRTSTWGLVGAGAQAESRATLVANDNITFASDSALAIHGFGRMYAGANHGNNGAYSTSTTRVATDSRIWNKTAIPISTGKISVATNEHNSNINVLAGADVSTQRHLRMKAIKGDQQGQAFGAAYDWTTALTTRDTYGTASNIGSTSISVEGSISTGLDSDVAIEFGTGFTPYFADGSNQLGTRVVTQNADGEWELYDGDTLLGTLDAEVSSVTGEVSWSIINESLSTDLDTEIARLTTAKSQFGTNRNNQNAIDQLASEIIDLEQMRDATSNGSNFSDLTSDDSLIDFENNLNASRSQLDANSDGNADDSSRQSDLNSVNAQLSDINSLQTNRATRLTYDSNLDGTADDSANASALNTVQTNITSLHTSLNASAASANEGVQDEIDSLVTAESGLTDLDSSGSVDIEDLIAKRNNEKAALEGSSDSEVNASAAAIDARLAELNAKKLLLNTSAVNMINVGDLFTASGNVELTAQNVTGTGSITSDGTPSISVVNNGSMVMKLGRVDIADDASGGIYVNDSLVSASADINALQSDSNSLTLTSTDAVFTPTLSIVSNYDKNSSTYNPSGSNNIANIKNPELFLAGEIINRGGSVTVTNQTASIISTETIYGGTVTIASGGDVFLGNPSALVNIGATPDSTDGFGTYAATREAADSCSGSGNTSCTSTASQVSESSFSVAAGSVFITGETINVNGVIQSGFSDIEVNVNQAELDAAYAAAGDNRIHTFKVYRAALNGVGNDRVVQGDSSVSDTNQYQVVYAELDRGQDLASTSDDVIRVNGTQIKGGQVVLSGRIASTGKGLINVVDGYGRIAVTNTSNIPVELGEVDAGDFGTAGLEGSITFMDRQKDNGTSGVPLVTRYTRLGDNINVHTNAGLGYSTEASTLVSNSATGRSTTYTPTDDLRYNWMGGNTQHDKKTYTYHRDGKRVFGVAAWDVAPNSWSDSHITNASSPIPMSTSQLSAGEFVSVASSGNGVHQSGTDADYAFSTTDVMTSTADITALGLQDADGDSITSNNFIESSTSSDDQWWCNLFYQCWSWDATKVQHEFVDNYYYHSVKADQAININFMGLDAGVVNVSSDAGIVLGGNVRNSSGSTTLTSSQGSILNSAAATTNSLRTDNITLSAVNGDLGSADNRLRLRQAANDTVTISANNAYIKSPNGNINLAGAVSLSGTLDLYAHNDIDLSGTTGTLLTADTIRLRAFSGQLNDGNSFNVNTDADNGGVFYARAGSGQISVTETAGDMAVEEIRTTGDITLNVIAGSLLDGNSVQTADVMTQDQLAAMWSDDVLALTNDGGAADDRRDDQLANYTQAMETLYNDYWSLRNVSQSGSEYTADAYDENFSYEATADEQAALDNNASLILNFESTQTARYQQGHQKFGTISYDDSFSYAASASSFDAVSQTSMTSNYSWTQAELESPIPNFGFKEITDTTMFIEDANILGANVTINTTGSLASIGTKSASQSISVADLSALTSQQKLDLAAAEGSDVSYDADTQTITLEEREDIDIHATGNITLAANEHVFVGGEENAKLMLITAGDEAQIKVTGNITNERTDALAVITADDLVLESAAGFIGTTDSMVRIALADSATLTARALNNININELVRDVNVGAMFTDATINLTSAGGVFDSAQDELQDIKAGSVNLVVGGNVGAAILTGDTDIQARNKALEIASVDGANGQINITRSAGSVFSAANLYTPSIGGTGANYLRIGNFDLNGSLTLASSPDVVVNGDITTLGNDVAINAQSEVLFNGDITAVNEVAISSQGEATFNGNISTIGEVAISGQSHVIFNADIATSGSDVTINAQGNADFTALASIATANGNVVISMSDWLGQDLTMASGAGINAGSGSIRIDTSGSMSINNLVSSANGAEAIYLSGFDILNSSDVNSDIALNGNGDLRLNAHRYIDLDGISYTGSQALDIQVSGVNANALVPGARLEIDASAGVNFSKSHVVRGVYVMPNSYSLNIADGKVNYDQFIQLNTIRGRVGRLDHHGIDFSEWGAAPNELDVHPNFAGVGTGEQHFRITGDAGTRASDTSVLTYSLNYTNSVGVSPLLTTDAFMLQYDRSRIRMSGNGAGSQDVMQRIVNDGLESGRINVSNLNVFNGAVQITPITLPQNIDEPEIDNGEDDEDQPTLIIQSASASLELTNPES